MKRDIAGVIGPWLAIITFAAAVVARFVGVEQITDKLVEQAAHEAQERKEIEARVRTLETSRTLELQISQLTAKISALEVQVSSMREDLRNKRR